MAEKLIMKKFILFFLIYDQLKIKQKFPVKY